jgi:hypothetical protein
MFQLSRLALFILGLVLFTYPGKSNGQPVVKDLAYDSQCKMPQGLSFGKDGMVYVACFFDGKIIKIDPVYGEVTTLSNSTQCLTPTDVSVSDDSTVYVSCLASGVVMVVGQTVFPFLTKSTCRNPGKVFLGKNIYVSCNDGNSTSRVLEIDGDKPIRTLANSTRCPQARSVVADSSRDLVYTGCTRPSGGAIVTSAGDFWPIVNSSECQSVSDLYINNRTGSVYIACADTTNVYTVIKVSIVGGFVVTNLATSSQCSHPRSISVDIENNIVYVACDNGIISIVNGIVTTLVNANRCPSPFGVAIGRDNRVIYATCNGAGGGQATVIAIGL